MGWRSLMLVSVLTPACSFVFVKDPPPVTNPQVPLECTSSRVFPLVDLAIGAVLGGLVFATTYEGVERINEDCTGGACYTPWKPALLATFLTVSPFGISSIVGFSDTGRCRAAYRTRGLPPP